MLSNSGKQDQTQTAKVKLTRATMIRGERHEAGEELELTRAEINNILVARRGELVPE
jgi:hypothetical protein